MNIVTTQFRENYGAHDWDGTGECPQYWKNKGGDTYVLQDGTDVEGFCKAISHSNNYSEVFVIDSYETDTLPEEESWAPHTYVYPISEGFGCSIMQENDGDMRSEIESKYKSWTLNSDSNITDHQVIYTMTNGDIINGHEGLTEWYDCQNLTNNTHTL